MGNYRFRFTELATVGDIAFSARMKKSGRSLRTRPWQILTLCEPGGTA